MVNNGASVTLSGITLKFWAYDTSGVSLVGSITTGGCLWNPTCSHNLTGVTITSTNFSPACGPSTTQMANWEFTVSTTDTTVLSQGTSWVGLETLVNRSDSQAFSPGTAYWYSPCVNTSTYSTNSHYALYLKGNLVTASGGTPPSCRPLPTCTPSGGNDNVVADILGRQGTPTPTPIPGLITSAVAAPNLSTGGEPIKFRVNLNSPARIQLKLFALTGEQVFSAQDEGNAGLNTLDWNLQNGDGQAVASGLYIYVLRANDGQSQETRMGKVVILR